MPRSKTVPTDSEWLLEQGIPISTPIPVPHRFGDEVAAAMQRLELDDQDMLRMIYHMGWTFEFVALVMQLRSRQSAHWRVQRALKRLKVLLAEEGVEYGDE